MLLRLLPIGSLASVVVAATLAMALLAASPEVDERAQIEALEVKLDGTRVLLSFKLANAFDEDFRRSIDSGLPTQLRYDLHLQRDRKRWFDKDLRTSTLQVAAMYNAVTREYLINYKHDGTLIESRVVREPAELPAAMTEIEALPAFSVAGLTPERRLLVRVRAELGTRMTLGFIPTTVTTGWAESRKFRPPTAGS